MPQADDSAGAHLRPVLDVFYYLVFAAVAVRLAVQAATQGFQPLAQFALLAVFLLLSLLQPVVYRRLPALLQPCLALAAAITTGLLFTKPRLDYYALLYVALSLSVTRFLPLGASPYWLGGFCLVLTAALSLVFGLVEGLSYIPVYIAGVLVIGLYGRANRKAEEARARSEELAARLQEVNRRLKVYAERAEEVATAQERSRLARELHDAVTQTVFSMNLTAEAARLACEATPQKVPNMLDRLQELGRDALAEMRSLVDELRPRTVAEIGLVRSLQKHLAMRRRRDELAVQLEVAGQEQGGEAVKEALFRTAQEALNNVQRHSGVKQAAVELSFGDAEVSLRVRDAGQGFTLATAAGGESFGLINMRERVEALGGTFRLVSAPGAGTTGGECPAQARGAGMKKKVEKAIRVLIVDDHAIVREGLRTFLGMLPDIELVGEAGSGEEALAAVARGKPEVVLMDLVMPGMDGIEATRRLHAEHPEVKVIALTSFTDDDKVYPVIKAGAVAYLLKDIGAKELAEAIRAAAKGEVRLHPEVTRRLMSGIAGEAPAAEPLTEREQQVLACLGRGMSNKEIAAELFISEKTVKTHVSNVLDKLGLADRTQAALYAVKHGLA